MKKTLTILCLLLNNYICFAGGVNQGLPVTAIMPASNPDTSNRTIVAGTEVLIGYDPLREPCLQSLPNFQNITHFTEIDSNNNIEITISALGVSPCFDVSTTYAQFYKYSLGVLPVGSYSIQMFWVGPGRPLPVPPSINRTIIGEAISFKVVKPVIIPALSLNSVLILILLTLLLSLFVIRFKLKNKFVISILFLIVSQGLGAKTFHVLLSSDSGTVAADDVMLEASASPSPPVSILPSFNEHQPLDVRYLISIRPKSTGNLQTLLNNHPNWSLAKLYEMLIVRYPDNADEGAILSSFANDYNIESAALVGNISPPSSGFQKAIERINVPYLRGINIGYINDLNVASAWELSEGMGYIGALDSGTQLSHPDLRTFDEPGLYLGGNLLEGFYQFDIGDSDYGRYDFNVDEKEPTDTCWQTGEDGNGEPICSNIFHDTLHNCDLADGTEDNMASISFAGHGTLLSGIIASKNDNIGICKNCGFSMIKIFTNRIFCQLYEGNYTLRPLAPYSNLINGLRTLTQFGIGTINYSGGLRSDNENYCLNDPTGLCIAKDFVLEQNVMLVASAGNNRQLLQFPASEVGTVAVGGLMWRTNTATNLEEFLYWNESPNNGDVLSFQDENSCPPFQNIGAECGSNISHSPLNQKMDVTAQAKSVYSNFYQGESWNDVIGCSDAQDGIANDGYGYCTGTSMSAPQVASIVQLMRSANPLLPNGTYSPYKTDGLINILNASAFHTDDSVTTRHHNFYGYGLPDARLALEIILGKSNGVQMKTRLTPMFVDVSNGVHNNNLYTPFPQLAMAFLILDELYVPDTSVALVNEFTDFWYDRVSQPPLNFPPPRAAFYVFTTNNNPFTGIKNMIYLRRMEKTVTGNRNDTYAVSTAEIEAFHADSYNYAGIEGYILPTCSPTPSCIPTGAIALYRDETDNLNHKLIPTNTAPANSVLLGYVYLNQDTDGDGLIDGQEIILGTNINLADTDGDGMSDSFEYPPAGVPFSDPLISDIIFEDGFE